MKTKVSIIKCGNYDSAQVFESVKRCVDLLGGITNFIKPGSRVLVKPNMLMAKPPEAGITTHPEVVRSVIKLLKEIDCKIFIGDSPSVWGKYIEDVDQVYSVSGIKRVCEEEQVELVRFEKKRMHKDFFLTTWLDDCDYVVNVPKFKTHGLMLLTGGVKNLFGLVSGTFKTELHKKYFAIEDFAKILVDIYAKVKPILTIVDGVLAMEGDGPATSGKLRNLGLLFAGTDCVALDSVLASAIGVTPLDVPTTKEAASRNLGVADLKEIEIIGDDLVSLKIKPFILPTVPRNSKLPKWILAIIKRFVRYRPFVLRWRCIKCSACARICPNKCIDLSKKGIVFNYKQCIACFCCQETCPSAAIKIKKSILAKMIGL